MDILGSWNNAQLYRVIRILGPLQQKPKTLDITDPMAKYAPELIIHAPCRHGFYTMLPARFTPSYGYSAPSPEGLKCPWCGEKITKLVKKADGNVYVDYTGILDIGAAEDMDIPGSMNIELWEGKNTLDLAFEVSGWHITGGVNAFWQDYREYRVRYDFKTRRAGLYIRGPKGHLHLLGLIWPFGAVNTPEGYIRIRNTILNGLNSNCTVKYENRKALNNLIHKMEEVFYKKLGLKFKAPAVHSPLKADIWHGMLNDPLANMAWRLTFPAGPNLDKRYMKMVPAADEATRLTNLIAAGREGLDYVHAVARAYRTPDRKQANRLLAGASMYQYQGLGEIAAMIKNPDYYNALAKEYIAFTAPAHYEISLYRPDINTDFVWDLMKQKGERAAYLFLKSLFSGPYATGTGDIANTYHQLTPAYRGQFWAKNLRFKDYHDALTELYDRQRYPNEPFKYPEGAVAKYTGCYGGFMFDAPKDTGSLRHLGRQMHNCAGTYCKRVQDGECIVLAARDSRGKPRICIEVKQGRLMQAKLVNNAPVIRDAEARDALKQWYNAKKIYISSCPDLKG